MYASHFNWLQVSFRRTSLSSTGFESRKGERFPRAQARRYLPVSASILLYFESLILNPTLKQGADGMPAADICRKAGISQATYFNWKKKYDGLLPNRYAAT